VTAWLHARTVERCLVNDQHHGIAENISIMASWHHGVRIASWHRLTSPASWHHGISHQHLYHGIMATTASRFVSSIAAS
jgi:hypothetical protein